MTATVSAVSTAMNLLEPYCSHSWNSLSNCEQILTENARIAKWAPNPMSEAIRISSVLW
ncbi:MAG TPA: hypothetical protein VFO92_01745 [Nitrososphaeraceae archaeon]|nr:hypothetical protein [Nitrososphaeraceae archaeon]